MGEDTATAERRSVIRKDFDLKGQKDYSPELFDALKEAMPGWRYFRHQEPHHLMRGDGENKWDIAFTQGLDEIQKTGEIVVWAPESATLNQPKFHLRGPKKVVIDNDRVIIHGKEERYEITKGGKNHILYSRDGRILASLEEKE